MQLNKASFLYVPTKDLKEEVAQLRQNGGAWLTQRADLIEAEIAKRSRAVVIMVGFRRSSHEYQEYQPRRHHPYNNFQNYPTLVKKMLRQPRIWLPSTVRHTMET
jgi:hypothetical protein